MRHTLSTRAARWLVTAAAGYAGVLLARYFFPPHIPRYQLESAIIAFGAVGMLGVAARSGGATPSRTDGETRLSWTLVTVAFVAGAFALYAPALVVGFLSDDFVLAEWVRRRDFVHLAETGFVRPGVPLLWAALDGLPGRLDLAAHAAGILCHGLNAALVTAVARRLHVSIDGAIAAGVLFVSFPGLSEAVVWASGAQDVLMTTGCLTAVVLATSSGRRRAAGAVVATAAALMMKETAVVVPVLAALVLWGRGTPMDRAGRRVMTALVLVSALYAIARLALGLPQSFLDVNDGRYLAKQLLAGLFAALGAPWTDRWGRAHPVASFGHATVILALMAAALLTWNRRDVMFRQSLAAGGWSVAAVLPVFSLFYVGPFLEGARYVYLPAAGFAVLLAVLTLNIAARVPARMRQAAVAGLTAALTLPILPAISSDMQRWQAAGAVRDEILARAREEPQMASCGPVVAEAMADSVDGAFVFRHGLPQALGSSDARGQDRLCRVSWNGRELIVGGEER